MRRIVRAYGLARRASCQLQSNTPLRVASANATVSEDTDGIAVHQHRRPVSPTGVVHPVAAWALGMGCSLVQFKTFGSSISSSRGSGPSTGGGEAPSTAPDSQPKCKHWSIVQVSVYLHQSTHGILGGGSAADSGVPGVGMPRLAHVEKNGKLKMRGLGGITLDKQEKKSMQAIIEDFRSSSWTRDEALKLYVNAQVFPSSTAKFRRLVMRGVTADLRDSLLQAGLSQASRELLFGLYAEFVFKNYKAEIENYRQRVQSADLRVPHTWYPLARAMKRRFVYHAGPTNSGKTHNAIVAMQLAPSGVYCSPLRLLAMEIFDRCNSEGLYCSLLTGQEKQLVPGAEHVSSTIEMVNMNTEVDVAVIDEIQMIGDPFRGWAWTRAVQGIPAREIHLCGDSSALPLIRQLVQEMGEELEVNTYDRLTQFQIEDTAIEEEGGYTNVKPGDCVVAFSRRDIYNIKAIIEAETGMKACVVYGALPPEMRRMQAQAFNDPNSGYDVIVASDAVGMGMNLNIRRVIFHTLEKYDGIDTVPVSVSQIKQIAGRAGRRNSQWSIGYATCLKAKDMPLLREAISLPLSGMSTPKAGLFPEFEHLELYASKVPGLPFPELLARFADESKLDGKFFFCRQDPLLAIAKLLEEVPQLSVKDRYNFCTAPVDLRDETAMAALLQYASKYCRSEPCLLDVTVPERPPTNNDALKILESQHQLAMMWLTLALRFNKDSEDDSDEIFRGVTDAESVSSGIVELMTESLKIMSDRNAAGDGRDRALRPRHQPLKRRRTRRPSSSRSIEADRAKPRQGHDVAMVA